MQKLTLQDARTQESVIRENCKPSPGTLGDPQRHDQLLFYSSGKSGQFQFYPQLVSAYEKLIFEETIPNLERDMQV